MLVTTSPPVHRINGSEECREKGLCYYFDEKFIPGHRCQCPQLFMIKEPSIPTHMNDQDLDAELDASMPLPEILFHAIAGAAHPQTLRMVGKLQNKPVTVLIDGGSTHNFLDQAVVTKFSFPVTPDQQLQVMVANRDQIDCTLGLTLVIQDHLV